MAQPVVAIISNSLTPYRLHRAEHTVERDVAEHARDDVARRAKLIGLVHDEQRQRRGDDVADDGKEPDQRVKAEAHAGAGDDERGVKQGG